MEILSKLLFLAISYGLGYTLTSFVKNSDNFLERNLMRIGIGLGFFAILIVLLSIFKIPVYWLIYLILSLAYPVYMIIKNNSLKKLKSLKAINLTKLTKSNLYIILVIIMFCTTFFVMHKGSFIYEYLEDGDPWEHAAGLKYVKETHSIFLPENKLGSTYIHYLPPYPPAYDAILGMLHQTTERVSWTLKYFNSLLIALSVIFFYFFVKEWTRKKDLALFSTFAFMSIPCFLSHFIWASSLALILVPVIFYSLIRMKKDKSWLWVSAVVIAGIMVTQPSNAMIFGGIMFSTYFIIECIANRKFQTNIFLAGLFGFLLSMPYWGLMLLKLGVEGVKAGLSIGGQSLLHLPGSGTGMFFTLSDYVFAKTANKINNPIGVGIFLSFLFMIGIIALIIKYKTLFKKKNLYLITSLVWAFIAILGIQSNQLPISFMPHRFWAILAIPLCILAAEGFLLIMDICRKLRINKTIVVIILVIGVIITSAYPKYVINTSNWSFGGQYKSMDDMQGHLWLKMTLPIDTPVFSMCSRDDKIVGLDMYTEQWDKEVIDFRKNSLNQTAETLKEWLKYKNYEYFVVDLNCLLNYGQNKTVEKLQGYVDSGLFSLAHRTESVFIFKV